MSNLPSEWILNELSRSADPKKAAWLENYVKHNIQAFGVGIPGIRALVIQAEYDFSLRSLPWDARKEFLDSLMLHSYTEPKLAAILFLQLFHQEREDVQMLKIAEEWFDNGWIWDWNVCDWLCVRLLSPLVDRKPELALPVLENWNKSPGLWKARASLVTLAQCKSLAQLQDLILLFSQTLIRRPERFCKTAVGWALREFSRIDPTFVQSFLDQNKPWLIPEVLKNASKYL